MTSGYPTEEQVRQRAHQIFLQRGSLTEHAIDDWVQAENDLMRVGGSKIVYLPPTETKKTGGEQEMQPNELGSFAWFWASSSSFADESRLAFRPPDSDTSSRDDRLAA